MKTHFLPILILSGIVFFGCNPTPSGNLTIIESEVINSKTSEPIVGKKFYLEECQNGGWAGESCYDVDSLESDQNGIINYAFFHAEANYYRLETRTNDNLFCSRKHRILGGTFFRETVELVPLEPILKVIITDRDSLSSLRIQAYSRLECASGYFENDKNLFNRRFDKDTSLIFHLPANDTVSLHFSKKYVGSTNGVSGDTTIFLGEELMEIRL